MTPSERTLLAQHYAYLLREGGINDEMGSILQVAEYDRELSDMIVAASRAFLKGEGVHRTEQDRARIRSRLNDIIINQHERNNQ